MPWKELKEFPKTQDDDAHFPIELYDGGFNDIRKALDELDEELGDIEYKEDAQRRKLCSKYYNFRFKHHFHSFGYGAYCTWWTIEGWYDED